MEISATKKYLEIIRKQYGGCSDYRIAQLLDVSRSCVSRWSKGNGTIGDEPAARLADLCGLDPVEVLTEIYIERSPSETTRHYFEEVLKRTASVVLILPIISLFIGNHINTMI
ncbi:helix-turn-helix domain-containing protein [Marinobacter sp. LN3S78]|uniref:helix-turn-helix domain-containing protein n=1 Tax=Marinobacter sp. LN3S78 TaxID=3382300 RepID=UPI00387B838E